MASRARWASLLSYFVFQCLGIVLALLILKVQRAPLPRGEIAALSEAVGAGSTGSVPWLKQRIALSAPVGSWSGDELQELGRRLALALAVEGLELTVAEAPPADLASAQPCLAPGASDAAAACMEALEAAAAVPSSSEPLAASFQLLLVPASGCSALVLGAGRSAVLRWHRAAPLANVEELAQAVAVRLKETWFQPLHLEPATALFEVAPAYVFSFFLVGDCQERVAWDFRGGVLVPFLQRFFTRLQHLVDFEVDSQVVQCGSLSGPPGAGSTVTEEDLRADFLSRAGEWPGDTLARGARWLPPLVRFVAFTHSGNLRMVDWQDEERLSFAVQGWGTVALTSQDIAPCNTSDVNSTVKFLSNCEAQQVASAWVSNLRSWLTLPPESPVAGKNDKGHVCDPEGGLALRAAKPRVDGIADWELLRVARTFHALFVLRTAETLENLVALVDSLPDVVVRAEIGEMVFEAAAAAQRACSVVKEGDLAGALAAARTGLALALAASHDDTVVAQMYFSWEFKYAVYLPIALPIIVPIMVALYRQSKEARARRKLRSQPLQEAEHVE